MNSEFEQWSNSGRFIYCLISDGAWSNDEFCQNNWPSAPLIDGYRVLNIEKPLGSYYYERLVDMGFAPVFEFLKGCGQPMLLTHAQTVALAIENNQEV